MGFLSWKGKGRESEKSSALHSKSAMNQLLTSSLLVKQQYELYARAIRTKTVLAIFLARALNSSE
jgi:hypothetical protein